jgi:hypothetical protein
MSLAGLGALAPPLLAGAALVLLALIVAAAWARARLRQAHTHLWLPAWRKRAWPGAKMRRHKVEGPRHILFAVADHYEPCHGHPGLYVERERVARWLSDYPRLFAPFRDADGRPPRHSFFFPAEEYHAEHLDALRRLVAEGFGEVEIHLHHDNDTSDRLRDTLRIFVDQLHSHGHLGSDATGAARFGFVHGNWSLDNSLPGGRWCGVNDELRVLAACGCYADFTLPSAPSAAQTRIVNSIYYATDDPDAPRSHDGGEPVRVGGRPSGDLLLIQGPLTVRWPGRRLFGLCPVLENGNLGGSAHPTPRRVDAWVRTHVGVAGRPDWIFVKVHTHGCDPRVTPVVLGDPMVRLHHYLRERYNDGRRYRLHYVTAREMYNIVKAAESGATGDPSQYRDFVIGPPPAAGGGAWQRD